MSDPSAAAGAPAEVDELVDPSAFVCDLLCLGFALWTVTCHAVVWLGGNTAHLQGAAAALLLCGCALLLARWRGRRGFAWLGRVPVLDEPEQSPGLDAWPWLRVAFAALAVAIATLYKVRPDLHLFCVLASAYFALSYLLVSWGRGVPAPAAVATDADGAAALARRRARVRARLRRESWWLFGMGLVHAALALCAHVPDPDDTLYVNMALSVAEFPHQPLLSADTLHGVVGASFKLAAYRLQSLELGVGLLDAWTRIPALALCHTLVPALAAFCAPLALARLLRVLDPRRALWAVAVVLLVLVFDGGGGPGSYHKFGFIRLFQGKAIFATVVLPALMAYAVAFGVRPSRGGFGLLCAAQVAALGTTVTALWAAPVVAMLGVATALTLRPSSLRSLLLGLLSTCYVLGWGLFIKFRFYGGELADVGTSAPDAPVGVMRGPDLLSRTYTMVLGHGTHLAVALAISLLAWPLARTALARRFAIVFPLGFFLVLGAPWLSGLVSSLTTASIYWRVVWLLPVPLLTALVLTSPLRPGLGLPRWAGLTLCLLGSAAFVVFVAQRRPTLLSAGLARPGLKVDRRAYAVARTLNARLPPKSFALAPLRVSMIMPMLDGYSYPLATKGRYVPVSVEERRTRVQLGRVVEQVGPAPDALWFVQKLDEYHVAGVALFQGRQRRRLAETLAGAGFHLVATVEAHEIWTRASR